ncbi:unnamed protein product [Cyprideis torosa]|uniref:flavin prenyltransferase n=1 Tax=Cyprideis torosa TaxID=163714 RepID=A0A7R8WTB3_9CRUS|nr:unnamed protein product [Cyprideis torosa]CAG0909894.1 unnamed protein product [Cyprideis torosa]
MADTEHVALAITGASGIQYGLRLLEVLLAGGRKVSLMMSQPALVVAAMETDLNLPGNRNELTTFLLRRFGAREDQLVIYGEKQWSSPLASGSGVPHSLVICPCTTGTLAAVATGQSRSLIERAADVALKERRRLILMVRETPFSEIHLENMLRLTRMGAVVMPANPGFYHRPQTVEALVDFMVAKVLDQLQIEHTLIPRWGSESMEESL